MKKIILILLFIHTTLTASNTFLMPDEAFKPHAKLNENMQINADIELANGMYLYDDKLKFEIKNAQGISIGEIKKPTPIEHDKSMVFMESPHFVISLKNKENVSGMKNFEFVLSYQGCSTAGLCYEPLSKSFKFSVDSTKIGASKSISKKSVNETDSIVNTIRSGSLWLIVLTFLGFGILLSLTPCVFPMIPIISGLIVSQGRGLTTKKAFLLSLVYVLAMSVAYTIAGILAGLFGANLQATLQNPFVVYSFAAIFVALAMSMFGYYELKLPDSLVARVSASNNRSGYVGVAIMGFLSALIVGPCVAAPLAGALVYIGQTGDALLGGIALFSMSMGMGLPLIIVGVTAGKFMPKPGAWMSMVTAIFGILMLGVAIWMLEKVVSSDVIVLLYAMLGIGSAIYFGVFENGVSAARKTFGVILFIYSLALFIGVLAGNASMTKPLGFFVATAGTNSAKLAKNDALVFTEIHSIKELDKELAKHKGKKVLLDFGAEWCTSCKEFTEITFADKDVKEKMHEFVLIRADVTANTDKEKALSKKYGVFGPPAILFFDENSQLLKEKTIIGYEGPKEFLKDLNGL